MDGWMDGRARGARRLVCRRIVDYLCGSISVPVSPYVRILSLQRLTPLLTHVHPATQVNLQTVASTSQPRKYDHDVTGLEVFDGFAGGELEALHVHTELFGRAGFSPQQEAGARYAIFMIWEL